MTEPGSQITVRNVGPLQGTIRVPGAKNSALKLMAASVLAEGRYVLPTCPTSPTCRSWASCSTRWAYADPHRPEPVALGMIRTARSIPDAPYELVERIVRPTTSSVRCSPRCGEARLAMPGGDDFGARPIDMHVQGLEAMGAEFTFCATG